MDRCKLAMEYHGGGYNCAQSVLLAFSDRMAADPQQTKAMAGGLGGGLGGSHQEVCGAVSGGIMALGMLHPFTDGGDAEGKRRIYALTQEFMKRFQARFSGLDRCGDLLRAHVEVTEDNTPAAARVGAKKHCDILIVTAVEIVEEMLGEEAAAQ